MRRLRGLALALAFAGVLAACDDDRQAALPAPLEPDREAVGHYCGMLVVEHSGPKGQAFLAGEATPIWFSSARDALAFTMLPDEPKDYRAVYVNDMGKARDWAHPAAGAWVEVRRAFFVLGSDARGGMGAPEAVPFADRSAADAFTAAHGGSVFPFERVPASRILGPAEDGPATRPPPGEATGGRT